MFKRSIKLYEANKHRLLKSSGFPADETQAILLLSIASLNCVFAGILST